MIFFNGKFLPVDQVRISPDERGFFLGDGIFETVPIYRGKPFMLESHLERLMKGSKLTKIKLGLSFQNLQDVTAELIEKNKFSNYDAVLRITLTRGPGPRGLSFSSNAPSTILITISEWAWKLATPMRVIISKTYRNEHSVLCSIKSINFLENILAKHQAERENAQDAIFLNMSGNLSESTTANLFIVKDDVVLTPRLSDGVLPGITRALIISVANEERLKIIETSLKLDDLMNADEAFLTNSLIGVQPIEQVGEKKLAFSNGPITKQLAGIYMKMIDKLL